jgi:REP element-mobilizing transposase RayT
MVETCWRWLVEQYPYVQLDACVVMPNHLHGILMITDDDTSCRGGSRAAPAEPLQKRSNRKPLGQLIGALKTASTRRVYTLLDTSGNRAWQRNDDERIVRDEGEPGTIREYPALTQKNAGHPRMWGGPAHCLRNRGRDVT